MGEEIDKVFACGCGSHLLRITKHEFDIDSDTYLAFYEDAYYASQDSKTKLYFKRLWDALRGKRHRLFDVGLSQDDIKTLIATLQEASNA